MKKFIIILSSLLLSSVVMAAADLTEESTSTGSGLEADKENAGLCEQCNLQANPSDRKADTASLAKVRATVFDALKIDASGSGAVVPGGDKDSAQQQKFFCYRDQP